MERHLLPYLVMMARFVMLMGLALWVGAGVGAMLSTPVLFRKLERSQAGEVAGEILRRLDLLFLGCVVLLGAGLGFLYARGQAAGTLVGLGAAMTVSRLVSVFAVSPAVRALRQRLRDANAPATDAERAAFGRLHALAMFLLTLEVLLGIYAMFAIS